MARTQEIRDIESRRAGLSDVGEIILAFRKLARIDRFTSGEDKKLVEECDDIAPRLMDGEHHSAVIVPSQRYQALNDVIRIVCVQTTCRLIQEEDRRRCNQLAGY